MNDDENTEKIENLWPADLLTLDPSLNTPIEILTQQGEFLSKRTNGNLGGKLVPFKKGYKLGFYDFAFVFHIEAHSFGNFRHELFNFYYNGSGVYPISFEFKEDLAKELAASIPLLQNPLNSVVFFATNEKDFELILKRTFDSKKARLIVNQLLQIGVIHESKSEDS